MVKAHSLDGEIDKTEATLDDAIKSLDVVNTVLAGHARGDTRPDAINFPVEEALAREVTELLDRWKSLGATLVKELDRMTAIAELQYWQSLGEKIDGGSTGLFRRGIGHSHLKPAAILADLDAALAVSASLAELFRRARPVLARAFRDYEAHLTRVIERRRRLDFDIETARLQADGLAPRIEDRRAGALSARDADAKSELEADHRRLLAEHDALRQRERVLQPRRSALQRLIDIYETLAGALNGQVAAVNAMAAKLAVDTEQRIALMKALASDAVPPLPVVERSAPVAALIAAFEANVLAGYDLATRKAHVDSVFARRLEPPPPAEPVAEEQAQDETGSEPASSSEIEK